MRKKLKGMPPEEQSFLLFDFQEELHKFPPVDIDIFLKDPYYLGDILDDGLYPYWENFIKRVYPTPMYSPYFEIIMNLPLGSGKSSIAGICLAYEIQRVLSLLDPRSYYGIMKTDTITFCLFSRTKIAAQDVNWKILRNILANSDFFKEHIKLPRRISKFDMAIPLNDMIDIDLGSSSVHALGKAVFGGILDEANFQHEKSNQAKESYTELHARIESRFGQQTGTIPGKLFCLSSPKLETSFVNERLEQSSKFGSSLVLNNIPVWDIKHHLPIFKNPTTFQVFIGDDTKDPFIIEDQMIVTEEMLDYIIDVPDNYYQTFFVDLINQLRNVAGISTSSSINLFRSKTQVKHLFTHPVKFTKEIISLDFFDPDDNLMKYMIRDYFEHPNDPHCLRFIHIDIAKSGDRYGLGATYAKIEEELSYRHEEDLNFKINKEYIIDFAIGIEPKKGQEINFDKVVDFLIFLREIGYPIFKISADSAAHMSAHTLQRLKLQGFEVEVLSVDRTRDPYMTFKRGINEGNILGPRGIELLRELLNLRDDGKKIDHPSSCGKDIADGAVGSFWSCFNSEITYTPFQSQVDLAQKDSVETFLGEVRNYMGL